MSLGNTVIIIIIIITIIIIIITSLRPPKILQKTEVFILVYPIRFGVREMLDFCN